MKRIDITNNYYVEIDREDNNITHEKYYKDGKEYLYIVDHGFRKFIYIKDSICEVENGNIRNYFNNKKQYYSSILTRRIPMPPDSYEYLTYGYDLDNDEVYMNHNYYGPSLYKVTDEKIVTYYSQFDICHRHDGPAVIHNAPSYNRQWYKYCGLNHNETGPAYIEDNTDYFLDRSYFIYGVEVTKHEHFNYMLNKTLPENIQVIRNDYQEYEIYKDNTLYIVCDSLDDLEENIKDYYVTHEIG